MNFDGIYTPMTLFSGFLYKEISQFDMPVDNNKKIWKIKIPLKT
jgi:hypothetical protein